MQLGKLLLDRKVIEPAQLKEALEAQVIFGGRLGTNLLELGYVDEETLVRALAQMGGTQKAVLEDEDLLNLVLPSVRADFEIYESYSYVPDVPIDCPITAFHGSNDALIPMSDMAAWAIQTLQPFRLETVEGGHFFPSDLDFARRLASELPRSPSAKVPSER